MMNIEIWTDLTCPFCYMASKNFKTALHQFPHKENVKVIWRSFELDPDAPRSYEGNQYTLLAEKYNKTRQEIIAMTAPVVEEGASMGLKFNFDTAKPVNTFDAHRLIHLAASDNLQEQIREKLYAACFTEGKNIADYEVLLQIGIETGLEEAKINKVLKSDVCGAAVKKDEQQAKQLEIKEVPYFMIDQKYGVKGNKSADEFLEELTTVWDEEYSHFNSAAKQNNKEACNDGICEV